MDLNETASFVAVVREGSFTAAAKVLGMPVSTVSRQVKRLEERLGVRLMQRTTRKLHLTEAGRAYFERCEPAVSRIEEAESVAHHVAGAPRGVLKVSTPSGMSALWRMLDLRGFLREYPDIRLDLHASQRPVDIVKEGFDVALRGGPLADSALVARRLVRSLLFFVASPDYIDRRGHPQSLEDLDDHVVFTFRGGPAPSTWPLEGPNGVVHWKPRARVAVNDFALLCDLAAAGEGIALCELANGSELLRKGAIQRVLPQYGISSGGFWVLHPSADLVPPKVRAFVDHVVREADQNLRPSFEDVLGIIE